jgi:hypothetical protein
VTAIVPSPPVLAGPSTSARWISIGLACLGVAWPVALMTYVTTVDVERWSETMAGDGTWVRTATTATWVEHESPWVLVVLAIPLALAVVGLVGAAVDVPAAAMGVGGVCGLVSFLGMFTIGMLFVPPTVVLIASGAVTCGSPTYRERAATRRALSWRTPITIACGVWALFVIRTALWTFDREAPVVTGFADVGGATAALVAAVLVWAGHGRLAALVASLVAL